MMFSRVVFPDPDAPTTETRSPAATSKSTSRRARTGTSAPKLRLTFSRWTRGGTSAPGLRPCLEPDHDPVTGGEAAVHGSDADEAVRRQPRAYRHEPAPVTLPPLHPGPSVGPEGDGRDRHRQLGGPGGPDRDGQPHRCADERRRRVLHGHPEGHVEAG